MDESKFNLTGKKGALVVLLVILAVALSAFAVLRTSPAKVETLGTTNFSDIQADSVTATTVTATTLVSQSVGFTGVNATLTGLVTAASVTASGNITTSGNLIIGGFAYTMTSPITITGVISNVRLLYKQY